MLAQKTIVITGANGALGRAVVDCAIAYGATVIAIDRHFDHTREALRALTVDLLDYPALDMTTAELEKIDGLFNLAGGFAMGPEVHTTDASLWDEMFALNVTTMRNMCAALIPKMRAVGGGSIVNIGAMSAREGQGNMGAYCAAKSTVMRLTESMSKELRADGINVNAVLPSIIDTPTNRADMPDADFSTWVAPAKLAEVICFLGSERASSIHGALIPVVGLA